MKNKVSLFLAMICVFFSVVSKADIGVTNNGVDELRVQFIGDGVGKLYTMPANNYGYHLVIPESDFQWSCPDRYCILEVTNMTAPTPVPIVDIFTDLNGDTILHTEQTPYTIGKFTITQDSQNSLTVGQLSAAKK